MEEQALLCEQLDTADQSLVFLVLILLSILLSLWALLIQRQELAAAVCGDRETAEELPPVFPIRCSASSIVIGALGFFLCLALRSWDEARRDSDPAAQRSARINLWARLLVFLAALLRMDDLLFTKQSNGFSADSTLPA